MEWQDWKPDTRDTLLDLVRRGQFPPDEAEREAIKRGIGPLATKPDPLDFDPDEMPWWSLPMALAWIAWRNSTSVREHCPEYGESCLHWMPGTWNIPTNGGTQFERIEGYELRPLGQSTACRLPVVEAYLTSTKTLPSTTRMTVSQAEKQLFAALAAGRIKAIAKDAAGNVVDIPQREWPYLQLFEENERDVLKRGVLDPPAFSEIKFERSVLKEVWVEFLVEPYMIEPMMRPSPAGYVPLCSALHWIMTEAGRKVQHLEDSQPWAAAVERLMPLISTGEVQIIGRPSSGGPPRAIEGHTFAGISVSQPMHDTLALIAGDNPWISCTPYVDEEHWGDVFNDQLYVSKVGPAAWTHLQLRKSDVLREIVFADAVLEEDADTVYETGAPGRPSSMHLIQQEFSARHERGQSATSITQEADELAKWLRKVHPKAAAVTAKTIKNRLSAEFRLRSGTPKNKV